MQASLSEATVDRLLLGRPALNHTTLRANQPRRKDLPSGIEIVLVRTGNTRVSRDGVFGQHVEGYPGQGPATETGKASHRLADRGSGVRSRETTLQNLARLPAFVRARS